MAAWVGRVPFDAVNGDMLEQDYVPYSRRQPHASPADGIEWRETYEFKATLVFDGFRSSSRGSVRAWFHDATTNVKYTAYLSDVETMLRDGLFTGDRATTTWTFCKRSTSFGVLPA